MAYLATPYAFRRPLHHDFSEDSPDGVEKPIPARVFAARFGYSISGVYNLIHHDRVRAVSVLGRWWVYPDSYRSSAVPGL